MFFGAKRHGRHFSSIIEKKKLIFIKKNIFLLKKSCILNFQNGQIFSGSLRSLKKNFRLRRPKGGVFKSKVAEITPLPKGGGFSLGGF